MIKMLRVRDWDKDYENNRSREIRRTLWFPAPNDLSADANWWGTQMAQHILVFGILC